jgi:hypothetical protein
VCSRHSGGASIAYWEATVEPIQPHDDTASAADDDQARLRVCENTLSRLRFAAFGQREPAETLERVRDIIREHDQRLANG